MHKACSAFSIIEILAVVAIMGTLVALVSTGVVSSLESARRTKAMAQLRAIGTASQLYSNDHDGAWPQSQHQRKSWIGSLAPYLGLPANPSVADLRRAYHSPADPDTRRNFSYAVNDFLTLNPYGAPGVQVATRASIPSPAQTLHFAEIADGFDGSDHFHFASSGFDAGSMKSQIALDRYRGNGLYLFADGRVESHSASDAIQKANAPGSAFIHPYGESSQTSE